MGSKRAGLVACPFCCLSISLLAADLVSCDCSAAEVGHRGAEIFVGVDGGVADADLVVEVIACGASAVADIAYDLSANDGLAGHDGIA